MQIFHNSCIKNMSISESSLHPYIKGFVEEYGKLTVTDLIKYLREVLDLSKDDLEPLAGRSDDKFSQKVRNLVSHSPEGISEKNGYIINKNTKPTTFYAKVKINSGEQDIENMIISETAINERMERTRKFQAKKVDFRLLNEENTKLGDAGERFALDWERERLKNEKVDFQILDEVIHFSKNFGDGAGYDILSRKDNDYEILYIEVKTTTKGLDTPFYMSENEKNFMEINNTNVQIYRVYNYDYETNIGEIKIITQKDLENDYTYNPINYKVIKK